LDAQHIQFLLLLDKINALFKSLPHKINGKAKAQVVSVIHVFPHFLALLNSRVVQNILTSFSCKTVQNEKYFFAWFVKNCFVALDDLPIKFLADLLYLSNRKQAWFASGK